MCGIAGFLRASPHEPADALVHAGRRMGDALHHRGPDDADVWADAPAGLVLAHRRLSILDLSACGRQPMHSASGRWAIVYNGEIYNHRALRAELAPHAPEGGWRGHSDTEVLLAAVERWGVAGAVERLNGMFAFALWDRAERTLHLGRDRLGEKPLYYGWAGGSFVFGSELKALRAHPSFRAGVDRGALALYMRHNCIPAPYTIYEGVSKLPPGTLATLRWEDGRPGRAPEVRPYWSAAAVSEAGRRDPFTGSDEEAVEALDLLLRDAVGLRMEADVPLGAFLSGGVDSSLIVALMQAQSSRPVRTFAIGFAEEAYDETPHARAVAEHLRTEHTELRVTPEQAMAVIPRLPAMYDEPFADSSQIPTHLVCALAREHVTVSLSGDGGDELFGGYNRYFWGRRLWRSVGWIPAPGRAAAAAALQTVSPRGWDAVFRRLSPLLPPSLRVRRAGDQMHKLAGVLGARTPAAMYRQLVTHWEAPTRLVPGSAEHPTPLTAPGAGGGRADLARFVEAMMDLDLVTYLPDDILAKVDRASMAVSLEVRVPFLDHRVVELSKRLPLGMKLRDGRGKWILRALLDRYVPREIIERPKMGFGIPLDAWLRGPLRAWAEGLLAPERLRAEGYLDAAMVEARWREHLSGARNHAYLLWDVLMFQAWLEAQ